mgnify:CR=1 FL=1
MRNQCNPVKTSKLSSLLAGPVKNGYSPVCTKNSTSKKILELGALTDFGLNLREYEWIPNDNYQADGFTIKTGDFLVSRSNALNKVGRAALYRGGLSNCSYPDLIMKFRVDESKINLDFLEVFLQSSFARKHFMQRISGTSNSMVKITKVTIEQLSVPVLDLNEQKAIATILQTWDTAIKKTETLIAAKQKRFEWLINQLISSQKKKDLVSL